MAPPPFSSLLSRHFLRLLLLLLLLLSPSFSVHSLPSSDISALLQIQPILSGGAPSSLSSWSNATSLCSWTGIQWIFSDNASLLDCSSAQASVLFPANSSGVVVYAIRLPSAGLAGSIPSSLGTSFSMLQILDLSGNNLTGGIPLAIGGSPSAPISLLNLSSNQLSGAIPSSVWNLCLQLQQLQLDHNSFSSSIPDLPPSSAACAHLRRLDLSFNLLSGSIPSFLATFANLTDLDLSNNSLSGSIPQALAQLTALQTIDLANNNLTGEIPAGIEVAPGGVAAYGGNPLLCGLPLNVSCGGAAENSKKGMNKKVVAALVIGVMSVSVVLLALCVAAGHRHNWGRDLVAQRRLLAAAGGGDEGGGDVGEGKLIRFEGGEHLNVEEVLNAPGEVVGKSSYGTVYKAKLSGGAVVALRLLREDTVRGSLEFGAAAQKLAEIRYPNIVPLLACYAGSKGEKLLVYDYLSRGSLADLLYGVGGGGGNHHQRSQPARQPLGWARRHKIILGAARGLAHLHHGLRSEEQLIHGNLKTKNIIVDESFEGHLADYGLQLLMNEAAQKEMLRAAEAAGYKAPELAKMGRANPKTDVYNLGIVILEVLTGKKPREGNEDLPMYVKQAVLEERISDIFDLEVAANPSSAGFGSAAVDDGLLHTLQLAMGCCAPSPSLRPDIRQVVRQLEDIRPNLPTPLYTPTAASAAKSPRLFPPPPS